MRINFGRPINRYQYDIILWPEGYDNVSYTRRTVFFFPSRHSRIFFIRVIYYTHSSMGRMGGAYRENDITWNFIEEPFIRPSDIKYGQNIMRKKVENGRSRRKQESKVENLINVHENSRGSALLIWIIVCLLFLLRL